jgi:pilus assembly protein Flp/PilA
MKFTNQIRHKVRGASAVEYGMLTGLIAVVSIGMVFSLGERVSVTFDHTSNELEVASDRALAGGASIAEGPSAPEEIAAPWDDYSEGVWSFSSSGFMYTDDNKSMMISPQPGEEPGSPRDRPGFDPYSGTVYGVDIYGAGTFYSGSLEDEVMSVAGSAEGFDFGGVHFNEHTQKVMVTFVGTRGQGNWSRVDGYEYYKFEEIAVFEFIPETGGMRQIHQAPFTDVNGGMNGWYQGSLARVSSSDENGYDITVSNDMNGDYIYVRYDNATGEFTRQ